MKQSSLLAGACVCLLFVLGRGIVLEAVEAEDYERREVPSVEFPDTTPKKLSSAQIEAVNQEANRFLQEGLNGKKPIYQHFQKLSQNRNNSQPSLDIFNEDYPSMDIAITGREWINRFLVEWVKLNNMDSSSMGMYSYGEDSNTFYFYPDKYSEWYFYTGTYKDRILMEVRLPLKGYQHRKVELKAEGIDPSSPEDFDIRHYSVAAEDFFNACKLMDQSLTDEELTSGFKRFVTSQENFELGKLVILRKGLKDDLLYIRRDLTDDLAKEIYPDYSERLADSKLKPLLNKWDYKLGIIPSGVLVAGLLEPSLKGPSNPFYYSIQMSQMINDIEELYPSFAAIQDIEGKIYQVTEDDGYYSVTLSYYGLHEWQVIIPKEFLGEPPKYLANFKGKGRFLGLYRGKFGELIQKFYIEYPGQIEEMSGGY